MIQLKKSTLLMIQPKERSLLIIQPPKTPLEKKTKLGIKKGPIKNIPCHLDGKRLVTREKMDPLKVVGIFMFLVQVVKNFAVM